MSDCAPSQPSELAASIAGRSSSPSHCSACGVDWKDHLGIAGTCAENKRLRDIIRRTSTKFCEDGADGVIAAAMFSILGEASNPNESSSPTRP